MCHFARILRDSGIEAEVCSPEALTFRDGKLWLHERTVDLVYNRLTDFRLREERHAHLREACLEKAVVLTPHPSVYVRCADKRNLREMRHPVVPTTMLFRDKPAEEWVRPSPAIVSNLGKSDTVSRRGRRRG
mmetsp:Transcript_60582/g.131469  ORF Transcript_60582/g.131469 Transcript_60582/m.131469 type:complete len:132 (+) Transcript_60582:246-641(+)